MRMTTRLWVAGLVILSMTVGASAQRRELLVPLKFTPQENVKVASVALPPSMLDKSVEIRVEEARNVPDAGTIGQGTDGSDREFPVRTKIDVVQFVKDVANTLASSSGLKTAAPADRQLRIRLTRFWVNESNKAVGSMYGADVQFAYVLTDAAGVTISEGASSASANRYGRAGSGENCAEVLSDALKEAFLGTLGDSKVQTGWSEGVAKADASTKPTAKSTAKPVELKVGMSEAEAIAILGQPARRLTLPDRTLLQYADLVLTVVNGMVTDIQVKQG